MNYINLPSRKYCRNELHQSSIKKILQNSTVIKMSISKCQTLLLHDAVASNSKMEVVSQDKKEDSSATIQNASDTDC
jgi:hypothetical protein